VTSWNLRSPVALLIFNRPELTERIFQAIAEARPRTLYVVGDGPRPDRPDEADRCQRARRVVERINWPCELVTNYAQTNLGCKRRVASGLTWVFEQAPEAIVLEDDCLPHPTFFRYCDELLERYREDERVTAICGANFQQGPQRMIGSYYFSRYLHVWGWAGWRRAWRHYDVELLRWPALREGGWLKDLLDLQDEADYWTAIFDAVHRGEIDTWDYQWLFASWVEGGLCILPRVNLISNLGFGSDATHTATANPFAALPVREMHFPLEHPPFLIRDADCDRSTYEVMFRPPEGERDAENVLQLAKRVAGAAIRRGAQKMRRHPEGVRVRALRWVVDRALRVVGRQASSEKRRLLAEEAVLQVMQTHTATLQEKDRPAVVRTLLSHVLSNLHMDERLFYLNSMGILNYRDSRETGEEYLVRALLPALLRDGAGTVVDGGANVGEFSRLVLTSVPGARVIAFEPNPSAFEKLLETLAVHGERAQAFAVGLSDCEREGSIFSYETDLASAHACLDPKVLEELHHAQNVRSTPCRLTTLDAFCERQRIEQIDLLKLDVEGHEYRALLGAERMLRERRISCVMFEFNEMNVLERVFLHDFYALLEGFELYRLLPGKLLPLGSYTPANEIFQFQNLLAVRSDVMAAGFIVR